MNENDWNGKRVEWIFGFRNYFDPLKLHSTHNIEYFDAISKTISLPKATTQTLHSISFWKFNLNRFSINNERVRTKSLVALLVQKSSNYIWTELFNIKWIPYHEWILNASPSIQFQIHTHIDNTKFVRFQRWKLFSAYDSLANELWLARKKKRINSKRNTQKKNFSHSSLFAVYCQSLFENFRTVVAMKDWTVIVPRDLNRFIKMNETTLSLTR